MKKNIFISIAVLALFGLISVSAIQDKEDPHDTTKSAGGPPYNTNAPGEKTCSGVEGTSPCHSGGIPDNTGPATCSIASSGGTMYVPGQTYTITPSITHASRMRFGFQCTARRLSNNAVAGAITVTDATNTWLHPVTYGSCQTCEFICHKKAGTYFTTTTGKWSFTWTAPATNVGNIRLYACFNAANNDNVETGDEIYYTYLTLTPSATSVNDLGIFSDVEIFPNPSNGDFFVKTELAQQKEFSVFNVQGKLIENFSSSLELNEIDLKNQPRGVYFLRMSNEKTSTINKLVVE